MGLAALALVVAAVPATGSGEPVGLEARVRPFSRATVAEALFPVQDASGALIGEARWRIVTGTGNCCENYIDTTREGRILDLGGDFLKFSDDRGLTWSEVVPPYPAGIVGGWEGAVTDAPGGDILAATWSPWNGDRIVAYKFDAVAGTWFVTETVVHTPFFDRPWLTVVPGRSQSGR